MGSGLKFTMTNLFMMGNGRMAKKMESENIPINNLEKPIMEITNKEVSTVKAFTSCQTKKSTTETSTKAAVTEKVTGNKITSSRIVRPTKGNGNMESLTEKVS